MLPWVIGVIVAGVGLMVLVETLLDRFNIRPVDPSGKAGGLRDILAKARQWTDNRKTDA